jgi:DNA-binding LacI/PurR family transcriptional regulator
MLLVCGHLPARELDIDVLFHDRLPAFREAADHLAAIGRRRPAFIGAWTSAKYKSAAFFERTSAHGMEILAGAEIDLGAIGKIESIVTRCHAALEERFDGRDFPFDALMCTSDEIAVVAIDCLRRRGVRVPGDVAVVGFNNSPLAPYQFPPLASGDRRDNEVAAAVEEMLVARLDHPKMLPQRRMIAMRFVWRDSAGGAAPSTVQAP